MRRDGFVLEGTALALPLCLPGLSAPPPADECRMSALAVHPGGTVYAASGGHRAHLYAASTSSASAAVIHLAALDARRVVGVAAVEAGLLAVTAEPAGVAVIRAPWVPEHVLQEPFVPPFPVTTLPWPLPEEPRWLVGIPGAVGALAGTDRRLLHLHPDGSVEAVADGSFSAPATSTAEAVLGALGPRLWRWDGSALTTDVAVLPRPLARLSRQPSVPTGLPLHVVDDAHVLWRVNPLSGEHDEVGGLPFAAAGPMATTLDGRVFGVCGSGIPRLYTADDRGVTDLGALAAAVGRRRYGYVFSDAAVGADGQVLLAEDEDLGHLWVYLPRVQPLPS